MMQLQRTRIAGPDGCRSTSPGHKALLIANLIAYLPAVGGGEQRMQLFELWPSCPTPRSSGSCRGSC